MSWYNPLSWFRKSQVPEMSVRANPVSFNPTPGERERRNAQRLKRLYERLQGEVTAEQRANFLEEISRRERFGR